MASLLGGATEACDDIDVTFAFGITPRVTYPLVHSHARQIYLVCHDVLEGDLALLQLAVRATAPYMAAVLATISIA